MNGEFKIHLEEYHQENITKIFQGAYGNNLKDAYARSAFAQNNVLKQEHFAAGYLTNDSLLLLYPKEATTLKVYVETVNQDDVGILKKIINEYFAQFSKELGKNEIKWSEPLATISLENCQFTGTVKTRWDKAAEAFDKQRDELFVKPLSAAIFGYLFLYAKLETEPDNYKRLLNSFFSLLQVNAGLLVAIVLIWLFGSNKKEFTFTI